MLVYFGPFRPILASYFVANSSNFWCTFYRPKWCGDEMGETIIIADICHNRHNRRWCTFFKTVYFLAKRTRNFGPFWLVWAILSQTYACTVWRNFYRPKKCGGASKLTNVRNKYCQRSSTNTYILQIIYFCLEILIPAGWNTEQDNLEKRANSVCQGISNTFLVVLYCME